MLLTLLLVLLFGTSVRAQENVWLPPTALTLLDTIATGFTDWQKRTRHLHESNLIPIEARQRETKLLAKKQDTLLQLTYRYIGAYGFPNKPAKDLDLEAEKRILMDAWFDLPKTDSLGRAKIMEKIYQLDVPNIEHLHAQQILMTLLNEERDFDQRCMMTETLRIAYEKGTFNAYQVVLFLEKSYEILYDGERFTFDPGTSNTYKLITYAAELDGCW